LEWFAYHYSERVNESGGRRKSGLSVRSTVRQKLIAAHSFTELPGRNVGQGAHDLFAAPED
jgi:hypothetical protein